MHFFERNFETTRSIVASGKSTRKIQMQHGSIGHGAKRATKLLHDVINYDLSALLLWKNRRLNFDSGKK